MALSSTDKREIERITKAEIKKFLNTTEADKLVVRMMKDELKLGNKTLDNKIVEMSTKVVVELFKNLWQRKSFWENALKNVK